MNLVEYIKNKSAFAPTAPSSGSGSGSSNISLASSVTDGLMSSQDKIKLDSLNTNTSNPNDDFAVDLLSYYNAAKL